MSKAAASYLEMLRMLQDASMSTALNVGCAFYLSGSYCRQGPSVCPHVGTSFFPKEEVKRNVYHLKLCLHCRIRLSEVRNTGF